MAQRKKMTKSAPLREEHFVEKALAHGALGAKVISPAAVVTAEWVRWKCQFGCDGFGSSLVCPPYSPEPAKTRLLLDQYARGILFEAPEGQAKAIAASLERELFLAGYYKAFGMGAGPCLLCRKACAFGEGCRNAHLARPSLEACGIDVYATVRLYGFPVEVVTSRSDPQHYYGLVLVD